MLLIVGGVGVAVLVLAGIGGFLWFRSNINGWEEDAKKSAAEGTAFARGKASGDCLTEAESRLKLKHSFNDELSHKFFLRACLDAARQPLGFCDGVPRQEEIVKSIGWRLATCEGMGQQGDDAGACGRLLAEVQEHCHAGPHKIVDPQAK